MMQAVAVPKPHITPRMSGQVKGGWKYGIEYTLGFSAMETVLVLSKSNKINENECQRH